MARTAISIGAHLCSIFVLALVWLRWPGDFATLPQSWNVWLVLWYGSQNGEELFDLEILLGPTLATVFVCTLSFCIWLIRKYLKRR